MQPRPDSPKYTCKNCGKIFRRWQWPCDLKSRPPRFCSKECYWQYKVGPNNVAWKGGKTLDRHSGYIFANQRGGGHRLEHRVVMEKKLGRKLKRQEVVHHINGVKSDNRPENLEMMTNSQHVSLHNHLIEWSRHYPACTNCRTTRVRHQGHGFCHNCYNRRYWHNWHSK